jgi:hypothetical protein
MWACSCTPTSCILGITTQAEKKDVDQFRNYGWGIIRGTLLFINPAVRPQAYISQHLAVMKEAELVEDRKEGWNSYYRVLHPELFDIIDLAMAMNGNARNKTPQFASPTQVSFGCGCPKCKVEA